MDNLAQLQHHKTIRSEARRWVLLFNADEAPIQADIHAMQAWANRSPVHLQELERAEARWRDTNQLTELAVPLCVRCNISESYRSGWGLASFLSPGVMASVAATAMVLVVTVTLFIGGLQSGVVGNGIYGTAVGELRTLTLEDGSTLQLDTNSQAQVNYSDQSRQIRLLQGKAHFDVTKNLDRPFEVTAAAGLVRAVGTAFSVYVNGDSVEVLVDEGRVDLARVGVAETAFVKDVSPANNEGGQPQLLTVPKERVFRSLDKGQSVLFNNQKEQFTVLADKDMQRQLSWRKGTLLFAGEPLEQVVSEVGRYTVAKIEISDPLLSDLEVGGRFNIGDIEALFEVLEAAFDVRVVTVAENHFQLHMSSQ